KIRCVPQDKLNAGLLERAGVVRGAHECPNLDPVRTQREGKAAADLTGRPCDERDHATILAYTASAGSAVLSQVRLARAYDRAFAPRRTASAESESRRSMPSAKAATSPSSTPHPSSPCARCFAELRNDTIGAPRPAGKGHAADHRTRKRSPI